ncbi:MAG: ADP-forming succinate--CoA ligase subunit beta [Planctomycetes bacterium]|nr:ADP-forming succinate--CoA ligase subunit beta [Planctomycetota bacterium]MCB9936527.1 ADP-forming succinate--CoA ligase subunit beta [Planctomycetota bacterium]
MKIHEYQAKEVLRRYNTPLLKGRVAYSVEEAVNVARDIGGEVWVVKAQIHAGGRGKGGGVKLARSIEDVRTHAEKILGMQLVTHQTGPEGKKVNQLLVEAGCLIDHEYYLAAVLDRETAQVCVMGSYEGGMDIEEVAAKTPGKIKKEFFDPAEGMHGFQARRLALAIGIPQELVNKAATLILGVAKCFVEEDATLVEINPLVTTKDGSVLALDAKMSFDDNALFRHTNIEAYRDVTEEVPEETEAKKYDLSYIKLEGNIGCMVNGAGLAMSTMDIIKLHGGEPANFLDVGGGASTERVTAAFKLILSDKNVKAVLVNIFGGIMKCDVIAEGVIAAAKEVGLKLPVVVRLEGTNVEKGRKLLDASGLKIQSATDLTDAAKKVVAAAKG